jgi:hypothetical protein
MPKSRAIRFDLAEHKAGYFGGGCQRFGRSRERGSAVADHRNRRRAAYRAGEWLDMARNVIEFASQSGLHGELGVFVEQHSVTKKRLMRSL